MNIGKYGGNNEQFYGFFDGDFCDREEMEVSVIEFIRRYIQGSQDFKFNPYLENGEGHQVYFYNQVED